MNMQDLEEAARHSGKVVAKWNKEMGGDFARGLQWTKEEIEKMPGSPAKDLTMRYLNQIKGARMNMQDLIEDAKRSGEAVRDMPQTPPVYQLKEEDVFKALEHIIPGMMAALKIRSRTWTDAEWAEYAEVFNCTIPAAKALMESDLLINTGYTIKPKLIKEQE